MEPEQYYQLAGSGPEEIKVRVRDEAADTVKKELVLDAVAAAEGIEADEHEVMHQIEHIAEGSDLSPEELAENMRKNGTYELLQEEISRGMALDLLVENAVPIPMPEEGEDTEETGGLEAEGEEGVTAPEGAEPEVRETSVRAKVEAGGSAPGPESREREE